MVDEVDRRIEGHQVNTVGFDFSGSRVLVTGGTSGIGNAIATDFARAGAAVTITGTRPSAGDYDDDLTAFEYRQCQLADTGSIDALAAGLEGLDVLVNNAGAPYAGGKDEWDPEGYAGSVEVNLFAPMRLSMACHDKLKVSTAPGGASIVTI